MTANPGIIQDQATVKSTADLLMELHEHGVTYQAIADRLGVNWRTVHRWRNEQTHPKMSGLINVELTAILTALDSPF